MEWGIDDEESDGEGVFFAHIETNKTLILQHGWYLLRKDSGEKVSGGLRTTTSRLIGARRPKQLIGGGGGRRWTPGGALGPMSMLICRPPPRSPYLIRFAYL